jgi:hypothetical protein
MTNKYVTEAKAYAVKAIRQKFKDKNTFDDIIPFVDYLNRAGARLHTRYENQCNGFDWDKNGKYTENYDRVTDLLEASLLKRALVFGFKETRDVNERRRGAFIRLQTDPRGWSIYLIIDGREYALGGRA